MRLPARVLSCGLCALLATVSAAPPVAVLSAQGQWFESYRDGLTAWQKEDWDRAEAELKEALSSRSDQGRNIPVPGRPGINYLPEYYLGLVYVKQKRFQEASDLLYKVLKTPRLVEERHPEFKVLQAALDECRRGNIDSFRARTVKIDAVRADGESETGTGIIVSAGEEGLHIVTALHVMVAEDDVTVPAPRSVQVSFFAPEDRPQAKPVDARWLNQFDAGLDLAAIRAKPPQNVVLPLTRWEYRQSGLGKQERIFTVGHAVEDYGASETNVVLNPVDRDSRRFVISTAGIGQSASGGPVIDNRGYLAGVMVRLLPGSGRASAVQVDEVVRLLKLWRIDVAGQPGAAR